MIFKENTLATTNPRETPEGHVPGTATPHQGGVPPKIRAQLAADIAEAEPPSDDVTPEGDGCRSD